MLGPFTFTFTFESEEFEKFEKVGAAVVRFPNCQECQLGFQCPKKLEIGKQWPVVEKNYIATVIKLGKLTSSASQEKMSAKKILQGLWFLGWKTKHFLQAILISAGGHFHLRDLFF